MKTELHTKFRDENNTLPKKYNGGNVKNVVGKNAKYFQFFN
jgi:hypothetical protein